MCFVYHIFQNKKNLKDLENDFLSTIFFLFADQRKEKRKEKFNLQTKKIERKLFLIC